MRSMTEHQRNVTVEGHGFIELVLEDIKIVQPIRFNEDLIIGFPCALQREVCRVLRNTVDMGRSNECEIQTNGLTILIRYFFN